MTTKVMLLEIVIKAPVYEALHLDPVFLDDMAMTVKEPFELAISEDKSKSNGACVSVMEPNISSFKNCMLPPLIGE